VETSQDRRRTCCGGGDSVFNNSRFTRGGDSLHYSPYSLLSNFLSQLSLSPHNSRQSPFGTNIEKYETLTKYSFEDADDRRVKVFIPLDNVGKLEPENVTAQFGLRAFELLVHGLNGKNYRLGCSKTHAEIDETRCSYAVRANRVTLTLRKKKDGDVWFDLFKKKAIGDKDDP